MSHGRALPAKTPSLHRVWKILWLHRSEPRFAQLRVKYAALSARFCSSWLNQRKSGHFRLALVQRPCRNTTQLAGSLAQSLPVATFVVILPLLWAREELLHAVVLSEHMPGSCSVT